MRPIFQFDAIFHTAQQILAVLSLRGDSEHIFNVVVVDLLCCVVVGDCRVDESHGVEAHHTDGKHIRNVKIVKRKGFAFGNVGEDLGRAVGSLLKCSIIT